MTLLSAPQASPAQQAAASLQDQVLCAEHGRPGSVVRSLSLLESGSTSSRSSSSSYSRPPLARSSSLSSLRSQATADSSGA